MFQSAWNLDGRWTASHRAFVETANCDVWLLTEVPDSFEMADGTTARSESMREGKTWSAVWSVLGQAKLTSTHPAASLAVVDGTTICSCVLPWRGGRRFWPDQGPDIASITRIALSRMRRGLATGSGDLVWGGDWNHGLQGPEHVGTAAGRSALTDLTTELGLQTPTASLPHRFPDMFSIDHIAVPKRWNVSVAARLAAESDGRRLSDHDAYVIELEKH